MRWVGWSQSEMQKFRIERATERAVGAAHECNRYLQEQAPWAKDVSEERRQIVVRSALEAAYILAHLLEPVRETKTKLCCEHISGCPLFLKIAARRASKSAD